MQDIERRILTTLIQRLKAEGYQPVALWDGEEYQGVRRSGSAACIGEQPLGFTTREALKRIDSVDTSTLHFTHRGERTWGNRGVFIVLGNGPDVISDFHSPNNEPFATVIDSVIADFAD